MNTLKSLKKYQIQPIEKLSCIRGGTCTVTGSGRRELPDGTVVNWSADAQTETSFKGFSGENDRARAEAECAAVVA